MFKPYGNTFVGLGAAADDDVDDDVLIGQEATGLQSDLDAGEGARIIEDAIAKGRHWSVRIAP
jgi:hypothetical protein